MFSTFFKENGTIDFEEFVMMMSKQSSSKETDLRRAFEIFDADGNGTIDKNELRQAMERLGERLTDADLDQMMNEADTDGNGEIDFKGMNMKKEYFKYFKSDVVYKMDDMRTPGTEHSSVLLGQTKKF